MKYKVEVTQEDIDKGKKDHNVSCPIARAVRRQTKEKFVRVWLDNAYIGNSWNDHKTVSLPQKAQSFIRDFDMPGKRTVKPFSFTLNVK